MSTSIEHELSHIAPTKDTLVSIGMFDGLHMGHQALVRRLVEQSRAKEMLSAVITFKQHPSALLTPHSTVPLLTSLDERICLLKNMDVDVVAALTFSPELAALGAQHFVSILQCCLKVHGLILGWDFALGHQREGSLETLHTLGQHMGFTTEVVSPVEYYGKIVSSTTIRQTLATGNITDANAMLTRPFRIEGTVIAGDARGTTLGFPTANIAPTPQQALPADGAYATIATINDQTHPSATFIGTRPTFDGVERIVETHLLNYCANLYNHNLKIDIIERLRGVTKFPDAEALQAQIALDILQVRQILSVPDCEKTEKS
ncbi:MAG: bifunctional riboflavin kinase/FAD synthetase [Dehalococcoidia bacterium]|nr:bifunctional riboflavin kinase/FAD synthetase [Dehalococcoidia bacterium]